MRFTRVPGIDMPVNSGGSSHPMAVAIGLLGALTFGLALAAVQPVQFKVVDHTTVWFEGPRWWPSLVPVVAVSVVLLWLILAAGRARNRGGFPRWQASLPKLWPLLLCAPLSAYVFSDSLPPFYLTFLLLVAGGWTAFGLASRIPFWPRWRRPRALALISLGVLVSALAILHVAIQIRFFDHLMFGHADIGHFTEELKNALAGRGLRSDSFDHSRLGWHFVPLMYVLVPGYALWPSPVYLMVVNALIIHVVAIPVYFLARRLSGSALVGWIWGMAWLMLPSLGRLVYANTYGFQWNNVTMPIIGLMIAAGVTHRWRACVVLLGVLCLCRETAAGVAFGWGLYVALFTPRRKLGIGIAVLSIVYVLIGTRVLIPYFGGTDTYARMSMFGDLGTSWIDLMRAPFSEPRLFFGRLMRPQLMYFLLMLVVPMAMVPVQGWRVLVAVFPTVLILALVENEDWMSIKFWHQASILPVVFFAGITAMKRLAEGATSAGTMSPVEDAEDGADHTRDTSIPRHPTTMMDRFNLGLACAVLVSAALGHYLYGFSPFSKAYEPHAANAFLQRPDPRMDFVRHLRAEVPRERTILATERLAAHFTDYNRLYTGRRMQPADYVIIDRSDYWDTSGLPGAADRFANDPDYELLDEFGSIIVFRRRSDVSPVSDD